MKIISLIVVAAFSGLLAIAQDKAPRRADGLRAQSETVWSGDGILVETDDAWIVAPGGRVPASSFGIAKPTNPVVDEAVETIEASGWMDLSYDVATRTWNVRVTDETGMLVALSIVRAPTDIDSEIERLETVIAVFAYMRAGEQPESIEQPSNVALIRCPPDKTCCDARLNGQVVCSSACKAGETPSCTVTTNGARCTCLSMAK